MSLVSNVFLIYSTSKTKQENTEMLSSTQSEEAEGTCFIMWRRVM
jgi:hypothetical protein